MRNNFGQRRRRINNAAAVACRVSGLVLFLLCGAPHKRKNWLFSWTELGAKHVGIVQSLLATCRLHDINPYDYFVDVLQRVSQHPASLVQQLMPRIWKEMFANNPLRSDLHDLGGRPAYTAA